MSKNRRIISIINELKNDLNLPHDEKDSYEKGVDDTTRNHIIQLETYVKTLKLRLKTLKADDVKYKDCEFNAPQFRRGMILQLEEILEDERKCKHETDKTLFEPIKVGNIYLWNFEKCKLCGLEVRV